MAEKSDAEESLIGLNKRLVNVEQKVDTLLARLGPFLLPPVQPVLGGGSGSAIDRDRKESCFKEYLSKLEARLFSVDIQLCDCLDRLDIPDTDFFDSKQDVKTDREG